MIVKIPGYQFLEAIHEGFHTVIYRAFQESTQKSVILKTLKAEYPTIEEITRLKHEYKILQKLDNLEGIVKAYDLKSYNNRLALILSDFQGESLNNAIADRPLKLSEFFVLAIQLVSILSELHKNQIIHKDIKPHNILLNRATQQVKLIDFSIATRLSRENSLPIEPTLLEGTLAYMSPEQSGRMNRTIDYRTDFYSLGVTFYELLTLTLPFQSNEPLEIIHCHIAKEPVPPHLINPEIPQAVSEIIMKLLAKTAEDRYQSALGIKADLEKVARMLKEPGKIDRFIPGQLDKFSQFSIPQKLYGRDREVAALLAAFDRVASPKENRATRGSAEMMMVSGYSGIGKTSVVNEVHKPIVGTRGYFIFGKFDQFKRNIPYASLIQAFQGLIRQLLTENKEKIAQWKARLLEALGDNGKAIADVIPEIELIVGPQPEMPKLGPSESQNRFNRVFQNFIHVLTQPEHPLAIFLDDLQWADSASLNLIKLLMSDPQSQYLLLIGAYRDNEVSPTHPLMLTLEELQKSGATCHTIALQPLAIAHVNQLVADTLHDETQKSRSLAKLIFNKTQSNPFFITQLLQTLYAEKLLTFDFNKGCWQWDINQIQKIGITDYNIVELIARNIQKLSPDTQNVLKLAACIGNQFNLDVLSIVNEKNQSETAADLWEALQSGLVLPLSEAYKIPLMGMDNELIERDRALQVPIAYASFPTTQISYKFLHDRVQQAAYSLIPEDLQKATHLKIGQLLLQNTTPEERRENIFALVNQLNYGTHLLQERSDKNQLAELNLVAGQKAKTATAYEPASKYLTLGLSLLEKDSWFCEYDLTLALHVETVEVEYLNTNFSCANELADIVLQQAKTLLEKVKIYEIKIQFYISQNQMQSALDTSLLLLEMLGEPLCQEQPETPNIEQLLDLPEMADPYKLAAMRILIKAMTPAFVMNPSLLQPIAFTMVNLCIKYGDSSMATFAYGFYGLLLCSSLEDIEAGYRFGKLAMKVLDKFNAIEFKCKTYQLFNSHIRLWKESAKDTIKPLQEAVQYGLESGDIEYATYAAIYACVYPLFVGKNLEDVQHKQTQYIDMMVQLKQDYVSWYIKIWRQLVLNLIDPEADKNRLIGTSFDEEVMVPTFIESKNGALLFSVYLAKAMLLYVFKKRECAVETITLAEQYSGYLAGLMHAAETYFYYSLILLDKFHISEKIDRDKNLSVVQCNQEKLKKWALHAPMNYQHKYDLVEAEKARVLGNLGEAMEYYDRAIAGAQKYGYVQEEALANERAAEFYLDLGREKIARTYLTDSYYGYLHWGAQAKVKDLELQYPQLLSPISTESFTGKINLNSTTTTTTSSTFKQNALDVTTILKASQALAGEIVLVKLLDKLLRIVMENAGAITSNLILEKNGHLVLEATGNVNQTEIIFWPSTPIETQAQNLPLSLINYVSRTQKNVVLADATKDNIFTSDPYFTKTKSKSVLCTPILNQGKLIGILYLENHLTLGAFNAERIEILQLLSSQVAISLENAFLYANLETTTEELKEAKTQVEDYSKVLEHKVEERTQELQDKNARLKTQSAQLEKAMRELKQTQLQLIQTEKMSSLGQMVAGVAHEINNPVNFIYGNLMHTKGYFNNMLNLIELYQQYYPNAPSEIKAKIEDIELEFVIEDFPKLLDSMHAGADRIRQIVLSLRNFSRLDESEMKQVDIHQGIDSTLLILQHRLKERSGSLKIEIVKEYGNLPEVECYPSQLNQVFMNILANSIDALCDTEYHNSDAIALERSPQIVIRTEVLNNAERIAIRIADNGCGMTEEVRTKVFDPFFTTKPVGSGTGLGLSISYQIVADKHGGELKCFSTPQEGTEFAIEIPVLPPINR